MRPLRIFTDYERHANFLKGFVLAKFGRKLTTTEVVRLSGIHNLPLAQQAFAQNTAMGGINLLVIDGYTGLENDNAMLEGLKEKLSIDFEHFIFPNNTNSGSLEDLLYQIIPNRFDALKDCFSTYETEILKVAIAPETKPYNLPSATGRIYAYLDAVLESGDKEIFNAETRDYTQNKYFDIHSDLTVPLAKFLSPQF